LQKYKNEHPLKIGKKRRFGRAGISGDFDDLVDSQYFIAFVELLRQIKRQNIDRIIDILSSFAIDMQLYFSNYYKTEEDLFKLETPESYANNFVF
jgi:hypothetical protein